MSELNPRNKIEAVLFSSGKLMNLEEISHLTNLKQELVRKTLNEIKSDYDSRGSSIVLIEEGEKWKLTVKDHYLPIVHKLVSKTELDKPLIETLAVIAWKYPVLQADVIKIRHNKAYEHMKVLEELGFITRMKYGRTKKITLTDKFFEYFDLPSKEAKKAFLKSIPENVKEDVKKKEEDIDEAEKKIEQHQKKKQELEEKRKKEKKEEIKREKILKTDKDKPKPPEIEENTEEIPKPKPPEIEENTEEIPKPKPTEVNEDKEEPTEKDVEDEVGKIEDEIKDLEQEENKDFY